MSAANVREGDVLWIPDSVALEDSNTARFLAWLRDARGVALHGYSELWRWSVEQPEAFWAAVWTYFDVRAGTPYRRVVADASMPGAVWFEGATLNLAEHLLRGQPESTALVFGDESGDVMELSLAEARQRVAAIQAGMLSLGIRSGDRIAAYMPNICETALAFLAAAGLGAIWSSCSPDLGTRAVVDRFEQIRPKLLLTVDGYCYAGKDFDRSADVESIRAALPSLESVVMLPMLGTSNSPAEHWRDVFESAADSAPIYVDVPFDHPLWIVYTSGTTGIPKGIVHGHGGILLESLVQSAFHLDLGPRDRFFWFSTTSWVMWNILLGGLSVGAAVVLYDGSPMHPDLTGMWSFAERARSTFFGTSASFVQAMMKQDIHPREVADLSAIQQIGLTGSPLAPDGFAWLQREVKEGVFIANISGGTDVCGALASASKLLPVRAGQLQAAALGVALAAYDDAGRSVVGEVGELVVTAAMPSMPLFLWNDEDGVRYHESYFDKYPGVWRHGDWIKICPDGSCAIYGRSDATLNRGGVRMGTSEFYRIVEDLPEVHDSLIVDLGEPGSEGRLLLFLVLAEQRALDTELEQKVRATLRSQLSPRHVPDEIHAVLEIPRTLTGKKLEVPVKRILLGRSAGSAANVDVMANPAALAYFEELAATSRANV